MQNLYSKKIFISGGIGQTPLMSMLESLDKSTENNELVWIHACRNEEVRAFGNQLESITKENQLVKQHLFYEVVNETLAGNEVYEGMLDFSKIEQWQFEPEAEYYICGPKPFIEKAVKELIENKISKNHIFFEEFGPKSI